MESNTHALSDIAYMATDVPTHIYPLLGFLSELELQGYNFDIYGQKNKLRSIFGTMGKNLFGYEELDWSHEGLPGLFKSTYHSFIKTIPAIEAVWEENKKKPKLIIADIFATYAKYLAKKHNIPLLVFHSTYFILQFSDKTCQELMRAQIGQTKRDDSLLTLQKEAEKYGITLESVLDIYIEGDRNFSCIPEFLGGSITLKKDEFSYIGPAFRDEKKSEENENDCSEFTSDNNMIYVSLGAAGSNIVGYSFYDTIIEALGDTEHKVLISAGMGKAEELIARGLPKNVTVKSWVPQMKVLEHSKLFISHVGAGGLMEAMLHGVPIIAVPNFADQPINAEMVERLNIGKGLKDKSVEGVRKLVEEVLKDGKIRESCEKYKGKIDPKASKRKFVDIVKSIIN